MTVSTLKETGDETLRLGMEELGPGRTRSPRRGLDAMALEDRPHAGRRQPDAQRCQLAVDAPVAPGSILPGKAHDQGSGARRGGGPPGRPVWVGPLPADEVSVPAQHRGGLDEKPTPASTREQPPEASEHCSVCGLECRAVYLSPEPRDLMAQHDDLYCEVGVAPP